MAEKPRGGSTGDGLGQGPPSSSLAEGPSTVLHPHPQFSSPAQSCPTLCEPMDCSRPGFPVHHQLPELAETHVHQVGDAMQSSHPVIPFSSHFQSFPTSGSFPMSQFFPSDGQSIGASASASVLPMNSQVDCLSVQFQFSHSVMSDSLQSHELQHARLPSPSPTPGTCSNSCPSSW